jgi:hypothetical protein
VSVTQFVELKLVEYCTVVRRFDVEFTFMVNLPPKPFV